ncbi:hypothetical protein BS47DRAFT_1487452 [Hydnum rufescens UP504]|uniref:Uncharacterized protein n=1 Tax=Hydnum rufescens UP504 TaxID=1448309 RepID=A0A9P6DPU8_9AGAM|nr:hypothetical protein BS47DRAFT_1487452 [Hydnum rufescens UP504]
MDKPGSTNPHQKSKRPKRSVSPASDQSPPPPVLPPSANTTRPNKNAPPPLIRADDPVDIDPALRAEHPEESETTPRPGSAPVPPRDRHARRLVFDRGRKSLQSVPLWHRAQDPGTTQRSTPLNPPEICEPSRSTVDNQPPLQASSTDSATVSQIASISLQETPAIVPVPISVTVEDDSLSDYDSGD